MKNLWQKIRVAIASLFSERKIDEYIFAKENEYIENQLQEGF